MCERRLYQTYSFWFYQSDVRISVLFLGPSEWQFSGADHTFPHMIRRSWARELTQAFPDSWRALPEHDYLEVLKQRGFQYDEYLVQKECANEIRVLCRSIEHLLS